MKKIVTVTIIIDSFFRQQVYKPFRKIFFFDLLISTFVHCVSGRILFLFFESFIFRTPGSRPGNFYAVKTVSNY